jgi:DNA-directed RNA polymerase subunit E'/Rpb7
MIIVIQRRICLDPVYLDQNCLEHLLEKIRDTTANECTKEYGYILSVERLVEIIDNRISAANSDIIFTVKIEVRTLKPDVGTELTGIVCMVVRHGVFLSVENDKLKVLIPFKSMAGYNYNSEETCYDKEEKRIKQGDTLSVIIVGSKYSKQNYSCYGTLVEE